MYTVTAVERDGGFTNEHGEFYSWKLMVKDGGGEATECSLNTRSDKPAPTVGQQIDGTLEPGKFRPKLKKNFSASGSKGGGRSDDPKTIARITRSHAQKMAVEHAKVLHFAGRLAENYGVEQLKPMIDWFEADVEAAAEKVS